MATIKDVAREAGVSPGTVSHVLNHQPFVKERNRKAVMDAVEKLNYVSNMTARTLRTRSSQSIGLIIPSITNPFYPEIARGVEDRAFSEGLTVFLCNSDRDEEKEHRYINELLQKNVDGMIIARPKISRKERIQLATKVRLVTIGNYCNMKGIASGCILLDPSEPLREGLELLESEGHYKIAFISGDTTSDPRLRTYRAYLKEKGIKENKNYIVFGNYTWEGGYRAAEELMRQSDPPTAIVTANDVMAIGAMKAIRNMGKSVPEDVSVIGCDDIEMSRLVYPALTTIELEKYNTGIKSVEILRKLLAGEIRDEYLCYVGTRLIRRESVALART